MSTTMNTPQVRLDRCSQGDNDDKKIFVATLSGTPHKANVFSIILLQRMDRILDEVEANLPCTLVVQGSGKFFSAGFDLQALTGTSHRNDKGNHNKPQKQQVQSPPSTALQGNALVEESWKLLARLLVFPAPTIALVNGHAFGLGLFLALACDHRIMVADEPEGTPDHHSRSSSPKLCLPEISIGLPLGSGFAALAKSKMRIDTLRTAAMTGKQFSSQEALKAGIIDAIVPLATKNKVTDDIFLPEQVVQMAKTLAPTSEKGNLSAIKMELYGEAYKGLLTGKSRSKL